jgi:hypothetical protein
MYDASRNGMSTTERIKDIIREMKGDLKPRGDPKLRHTQPSVPRGNGFGELTLPSARVLATYFKPSRTRTTRLPRSDPPLPLHDFGGKPLHSA